MFVDTAVFMYAAGSDDPLREGCRAVLREAQAGELDATTSAEVVQEILHRFTGTSRHADGIRLARSALSLFRPVLPIDHDAMARTSELGSATPVRGPATSSTSPPASSTASRRSCHLYVTAWLYLNVTVTWLASRIDR